MPPMLAALLASVAVLPDSQHIEVNVDGLRRDATVIIPSADRISPHVFGFHGHGGNMEVGKRKFKIQDAWPEAIVVYMQGVPTVGRTDPQGVRNGWQKSEDELGNRDLKFFDAILAWVEGHAKVDRKRIYAMGHSNGAAFSYLLWMSHPNLFAAIGSVAGGFPLPKQLPKPVPVIHIAGKQDSVVPYASQLRTVARLRTINHCAEQCREWQTKDSTLWESDEGAPVVLVTHPGTHAYPDQATSLIVEFFKSNVRR